MNQPDLKDAVVVYAPEAKSRVLHVRFGASEMARVSAAAEEAGLTVSAFMRSLTLEGAGVRPFFTERDQAVLDLLLAEIAALGVRLNQFSRAARRREAVRSQEERSMIGEVHRSVAAVLLELRFFAERGRRTKGAKT